jgi:soluble lytic murein transglycosylase
MRRDNGTRSGIFVAISSSPAYVTNGMFRFLRKLIVTLILAALSAGAITLYFSPDPRYTAEELIFFKRYARFDPLIQKKSEEYGVDPMLVKAVVWRESKFQPDMVGNDGERGLMQVTEGAAEDWVTAKKIEGFRPTDLFDPTTNLDVGIWYLSRALERWKEKEDPLPFALAEYNAGRSRVHQWIGNSNMGNRAQALHLKEQIAFPTTKRYIETIEQRYKFYRDRGRM